MDKMRDVGDEGKIRRWRWRGEVEIEGGREGGADCCTFLMCREANREKNDLPPPSSFSACGALISMTIATIR